MTLVVTFVTYSATCRRRQHRGDYVLLGLGMSQDPPEGAGVSKGENSGLRPWLSK